MPAVPPAIASAVQKDFAALGKNSVVGDVEKFLTAFVGAAPYIKVDPRPLAKRSNPFEKSVLTPEVAWKVASLVSWLTVHRPVGCPVRAGIPKVVTALRKVLADRKNTWVLEQKYWDEEKAPKRRKRHDAMAALVGGKPVKPTKTKGEWLAGRDDGTLILAPCAPDANSDDASVFGAFYTSKLDAKTAPRIDAFMRAISEWNDFDVLPTAQHIRSAGFAALGERAAKTPVPKDGYEANPAASAPTLVAKVANDSSISANAAALYLQTIALPAPTKANVQLWNGWTSEDYDAAAVELVKAKLVVEAKVDGAGRKIFARGAIVKKTKLNVPIEQSKLAFTTHGRFVKHLITEPCHTLFERALAAA